MIARPPSCISVTLKEFIQVKIDALKELLKAETAGRDHALQLQAMEYERRLAALNHEHEKNKERNAEFVTKEKHEQLEKEFHDYKVNSEKLVLEKATNLEKVVNDKAAVLEKSVGDKAAELEKAVTEKADRLREDFVTFKTQIETSAERAAGAKTGSTKVLTLVVAIVGFLWAATSVITGIGTVYSMLAKQQSAAPAVTVTNSKENPVNTKSPP